MCLADIHQIGGIIYAYWPVDYSKPVHKEATRVLSIKVSGSWPITQSRSE